MSEVRHAGAGTSRPAPAAAAEAIRAGIEHAQALVLRVAPYYAHLFARYPVAAVEGGPGPIAWTDGKVLAFTPEVLDLTPAPLPPARLKGSRPQGGPLEFVVLHELMHAAYAHPARARRLLRRPGRRYSHQILNCVADAIVNEGIEDWHPVPAQAPDGAIRAHHITELAHTLADRAGQPLPSIATADFTKSGLEEWHDALVALCPEPEGGTSSSGPAGTGPADPDDPVLPGTAEEKDPRQWAEAMADALHDPPSTPPASDLEYDSEDAHEEEDRRHIEEARATLARAAKAWGSDPGRLVESAIEPVPSRLDWPRILARTLRDLVRSELVTGPPTLQPHRPSARCVALSAAQGRASLIEPAVSTWRTAPALALCIDSSGSVPTEMSAAFAGQVVTLAGQMEVPVHVIVGDTEVLAEYHHGTGTPAARLRQWLRDHVGIGRGGTDFAPLVRHAEASGAAAVIYLTDGFAEFPPRGRVPVVWAISRDGYQGKVPHGTRIRI